jgi:hypothetical protein
MVGASMRKGRECLNFKFLYGEFRLIEKGGGGGAVAARGGAVASRERTAKNIYVLRRA